MPGPRTVDVHWSSSVLAPDRVRDAARWRRGETEPEAGLGPSLHGTHAESDAWVATLAHDGEGVCAAVVRDVRGVSRAGAVALTLVGALTTRPELRGAGHASALLAAIVARAADEGRDAVWVWAPPRELFQRAGFAPAGTQLEYALGPDRGTFAPGVRPAETRDVVAIAELHEQKPLRIDRTLADTSLGLARNGVRTYVLDRHRRAAAYACLTVTAAGAHQWIEVGGSDEDVGALVLGATGALELTDAVVIVPPYRETLAKILAPAQRRCTETRQGLRCALTAPGRAVTHLDALDAI